MTPLSRRPPPAASHLFYERPAPDPTLCQKNFHGSSAGWLSMPLDPGSDPSGINGRNYREAAMDLAVIHNIHDAEGWKQAEPRA